MHVLIVNPTHVPGTPRYARLGDHSLSVRDRPSGLKTLAVDTVLLTEGLSDEQVILACERLRFADNPRVFVEVTSQYLQSGPSVYFSVRDANL